MRKSYKTLNGAEYDVLNKVIRKTGSDCWCWIKQDCHGVDYIYDVEERKHMCLRTGVQLLAESLDCQENFDNCCLEWHERVILRTLLAKLNITMETSIDWKL